MDFMLEAMRKAANYDVTIDVVLEKDLKLLEENNILVDTAHLSRKAFYDFAKITTKPIYNSHANLNTLFAHPRNLTNKQIEKIVQSNGFLGLTIYEHFISKQKTFRSMLFLSP